MQGRIDGRTDGQKYVKGTKSRMSTILFQISRRWVFLIFSNLNMQAAILGSKQEKLHLYWWEKDEVRFRMLQNCAAQILSFQNIFRAEPIYKRLHPSLCSSVFRFVSRRQLPRRTWRFFVYLRHMYLQGVHQILFLFEYFKIYSGL